MKRKLLKHFGLEALGFYRSRVFEAFAVEIMESVRDQDMVFIVGDWLMGKTELWLDVKRRLSARPDDMPLFVRVYNTDVERLKIGSIVNAMIYALTDRDDSRGPKRDLEARHYQLVKLLGEERKRDVVVIIEDAHLLHGNTLRAIKRLRELDFAGRCPLFSVVLIGQQGLADKTRAIKEIGQRGTEIMLSAENGWMDYEDRVRYLKAVYGEMMTAAARRLAASRYTWPGEMAHNIEILAKEAMQVGKTVLDEECFDMDAPELYSVLSEKHGVSLKDIAEATGIPKTTVHRALETPGHPQRAQIKRKLAGLLSEKAKQPDEERACVGA